MKSFIGIIVALFVLIDSAKTQEIQHDKLKKVYFGAIIGSVISQV